MRSVTSSAKMAVELIKAISEAFNDGNILPTGTILFTNHRYAAHLTIALVFVFPPRTANNRGPMIWNDQILTFAGVSHFSECIFDQLIDPVPL
jgi:nitric oxide synthase oxygenase domain/subunit